MSIDDREKYAFVTKSGLWQWKTQPFGITSAPASFSRLIEAVLQELQWQTLLEYLDDVFIFSKYYGSHLEKHGEVLLRFVEANLILKGKRCQLFVCGI